ncbi:hypothetical protein Tco_0099857 [Tanacetum coccineum]
MFQQHQGEPLSEVWTRFKELLQKVPHHGVDLWHQVQIFYDHVNPATRRTINHSAGDKLHDRNAKESCTLLEDLTLYDNESWNNLRDFAKLVKVISLPQDAPSISDRRLIKLESQVQRLMEARLAPKSSVQVNKITSLCEIYSGPHDTQYCMENPEKSFCYQTRLERVLSDFDSRLEKILSSLGTQLKQQHDDVINKINTLCKVIFDRFDNTPARNTAGDSMAHMNKTGTPPPLKRVHFINSIVLLRKEEKPEEEEIMEPNAAKGDDHSIIVGTEEEVEEESEESDEETKVEEEDDL